MIYSKIKISPQRNRTRSNKKFLYSEAVQRKSILLGISTGELNFKKEDDDYAKPKPHKFVPDNFISFHGPEK